MAQVIIYTGGAVRISAPGHQVITGKPPVPVKTAPVKVKK